MNLRQVCLTSIYMDHDDKEGPTFYVGLLFNDDTKVITRKFDTVLGAMAFLNGIYLASEPGNFTYEFVKPQP